MRKLTILLFLVGALWFTCKEVEYETHRYFSEWIRIAKRIPEEDKVDRELSVRMLRELNLILHANHKSYSLPCLLMIVSGIGLIFLQQGSRKTAPRMKKPESSKYLSLSRRLKIER